MSEFDATVMRAFIEGLLLFLVLSVLSGFMFLSTHADAAECDGIGIELGIGAHDRAIDGPEYTTPNALGVVELSYRSGRARWVLSHTSSLAGFPYIFDSPGEDGYGANVASVRWSVW